MAKKFHSLSHVAKRELELPRARIGELVKIAEERKDIISLGPGEPDFNTPKPIIDYAKKVLQKSTHYSPAEGREELREAIVKKLKKCNKIKANPENIVATTGSTEGLFIALLTTVDAGEHVMVPDPGFLDYYPITELIEGHAISLQLKESENFEINPDRLKKLITEKTKVIILNTPSNPTGTVLSRSTLEEIADIAVENDVLVFSDEAYEDLIYENAKHVSIGSFNGMENHVVSFFTFSKSWAMPGFRLGYACAPEEIANAMIKVHPYTTLCAPTISQVIGIWALKNQSKLMKYVYKMRDEYDKRRKYIVRRLNEVGLRTTNPKGAFYTFSNVSEFGKDSNKFVDVILKKAKVAMVPGTEFGKHGEGFVRCSYATELSKIKIAMDRIEKVLRKKR